MDARYLLIFGSGLFGGWVALWLGLPMPFMLGGIFGAAAFVLFYERGGRKSPVMSRWVRLSFMAVIGAIIGSRFSPEVLKLLPEFWLSGLALIPYIILAHGGSYAIMRKLGNYKKQDAYFATLPGGIVDSIALAEQMGADLKIVTTQHFIRIILVVACIPMLFLAIDGQAVGTAAGVSMTNSASDFLDLALFFIIAAVGLGIGRVSRLPAAHMMGPLFIALVLSVTGTVDLSVPNWLLDVAQYFIGTALGAQFSGITIKTLMNGLKVGVFVGIYMLSIGALIAFALLDLVPADFGALFVSFAAGGLAEMSLIALSLNFNPVVVALHHLCRIVLTVLAGAAVAKMLFKYRTI